MTPSDKFNYAAIPLMLIITVTAFILAFCGVV